MEFTSANFDFRTERRCVIIGEIGVNHNGSAEILFRLIDEGIRAGLDIIKLQRFNSTLEISNRATLADYQAAAGIKVNQLEMARALELPDDLLIKAFEYCRDRKVGFLCTAFEHESVDFLVRLGCKSVKVPSPEISNKPLLEHMARSFEGLLISTGASYLDEVGLALRWVHEAGGGHNEIALMHCMSQYPAPIEQANLNAIVTMRAAFGLPVGYSDHTEGLVAAVVSAGLGATMIEKHYTLDKNLPGPDHKASIETSSLPEFVRSVHAASASLGDGIKRPVNAERETRPKIRKSLFFHAVAVSAGQVLRADMLVPKRPWVAGAVEPSDVGKVLGAQLMTSKSADEPLLWQDLVKVAACPEKS